MAICQCCKNSFTKNQSTRTCSMCAATVHETCGQLADAGAGSPAQFKCLKCTSSTNAPKPLTTEHFQAIMAEFSSLKITVNACEGKITACDAKIETLNQHIASQAVSIANCLRQVVDDKAEVQKILTEIGLQNISPKLTFRFGKANTGPRPLKVIFSSSSDAMEVLKAKSRLTSPQYKSVTMKSDLTPRQVQHLSTLRKELQKRTDEDDIILISTEPTENNASEFCQASIQIVLQQLKLSETLTISREQMQSTIENKAQQKFVDIS
ncbi:unnamed protein product [Ceutorhynchus assimilis]|uniref:Phorbol-ester/DAG-type domain-containing protein n=1 Tax=Ceutorhynchus assimilis TaxID=467358 RepID=A0A9N9QN06_9CUCU|nr:unnamed protein product [Ceutorhynchus assimilis]